MLFKNSVRTSKSTAHFTITKINWLMLFKFKEVMQVALLVCFVVCMWATGWYLSSQSSRVSNKIRNSRIISGSEVPHGLFCGRKRSTLRSTILQTKVQTEGRAKAQAVSCRSHTSDIRVSRSGQFLRDLWWTKWHWDRVFSEFFVVPCQYHSTVALHTHVSFLDWTIGLLVAAVQRHSLTPSTWTEQQQHVLKDRGLL
jgi:hypothetical protein